jgi:hypothetical protein
VWLQRRGHLEGDDRLVSSDRVYFGPPSGPYFIGRMLNAVCREIQVMEWSDPIYAPWFALA